MSTRITLTDANALWAQHQAERDNQSLEGFVNAALLRYRLDHPQTVALSLDGGGPEGAGLEKVRAAPPSQAEQDIFEEALRRA